MYLRYEHKSLLETIKSHGEWYMNRSINTKRRRSFSLESMNIHWWSDGHTDQPHGPISRIADVCSVSIYPQSLIIDQSVYMVLSIFVRRLRNQIWDDGSQHRTSQVEVFDTKLLPEYLGTPLLGLHRCCAHDPVGFYSRADGQSNDILSLYVVPL